MKKERTRRNLGSPVSSLMGGRAVFELGKQSLMICLMSFSKPLSSMRSASSRTNHDTLLKSRLPSFARSRRRPGVPTTMRGFSLRMIRICSGLGTPP